MNVCTNYPPILRQLLLLPQSGAQETLMTSHLLPPTTCLLGKWNIYRGESYKDVTISLQLNFASQGMPGICHCCNQFAIFASTSQARASANIHLVCDVKNLHNNNINVGVVSCVTGVQVCGTVSATQASLLFLSVSGLLVELCFAMATVLVRIANSVASYSQLGTE